MDFETYFNQIIPNFDEIKYFQERFTKSEKTKFLKSTKLTIRIYDCKIAKQDIDRKERKKTKTFELNKKHSIKYQFANALKDVQQVSPEFWYTLHLS